MPVLGVERQLREFTVESQGTTWHVEETDNYVFYRPIKRTFWARLRNIAGIETAPLPKIYKANCSTRNKIPEETGRRNIITLESYVPESIHQTTPQPEPPYDGKAQHDDLFSEARSSDILKQITEAEDQPKAPTSE